MNEELYCMDCLFYSPFFPKGVYEDVVGVCKKLNIEITEKDIACDDTIQIEEI